MYDKDLVDRINAAKQHINSGKWVVQSWAVIYLNLNHYIIN
jgi:hypothetical protein